MSLAFCLAKRGVMLKRPGPLSILRTVLDVAQPTPTTRSITIKANSVSISPSDLCAHQTNALMTRLPTPPTSPPMTALQRALAALTTSGTL